MWGKRGRAWGRRGQKGGEKGMGIGKEVSMSEDVKELCMGDEG